MLTEEGAAELLAELEQANHDSREVSMERLMEAYTQKCADAEAEKGFHVNVAHLAASAAPKAATKTPAVAKSKAAK